MRHAPKHTNPCTAETERVKKYTREKKRRIVSTKRFHDAVKLIHWRRCFSRIKEFLQRTISSENSFHFKRIKLELHLRERDYTRTAPTFTLYIPAAIRRMCNNKLLAAKLLVCT